MASLNKPKISTPIFTHEGAKAARCTFEQQLRRTVCSCLLWEDEFYEDGQSIAKRVSDLVPKIAANKVAQLAVEIRTKHNLRHIPLLIVREMARHASHKHLVADTLNEIILRADELSEFVSIYWKDGKIPLSNQIRKGLAKAFNKFNEYSFAKYFGERKEISIRDVMFLVHPKPRDEYQEQLFKKIANKTLATPDTWEVALSGGADKKTTFERLLNEKSLGYLALIRNLRNMQQSGVSDSLIRKSILARQNGAEKLLPFRFTAAARIVPMFEAELDQALLANLKLSEPLNGMTLILVDVSGSMNSLLSGKSDLTRRDAAATLASIITGNRRVFSFSRHLVEVPPRLGMAGVDAINKSQQHSATYLGEALKEAQKILHDRIIVITDEQSAQPVPDPKVKNAYMINVASYKNGIGYGKWTHIDGFSESVVSFIREYESDAITQ